MNGMNRVETLPSKACLAVCTLNRCTDLLKTLEQIEKQRCSVPWELLIVDNGSRDNSLEAARAFAKNSSLRVRVLSEPRRGISYARNRALREGKGDILAFVDDDVDCDPHLLEAHLDAFQDPSVTATGGRIVPRLPENAPGWLTDSLHKEVGGPTTRYDFGDEVLEIKLKGDIALPISCNLGLRREAALEAGGFRLDLGWPPGGRRIGGEDTDLMKRLLTGGARLLYLGRATVVHRVQPERATLAYYWTWNIANGRASVRIREQPGRLMTLLRTVEQLFRILRYTVLPWSLIVDSRATRLRKRYQALGRILELLGITGNT